MTLKQSQGQQTYNSTVDPGQGYKNAKFERARFNSVREKGNFFGVFVFVVFKRENMSVISLEHDIVR